MRGAVLTTTTVLCISVWMQVAKDKDDAGLVQQPQGKFHAVASRSRRVRQCGRTLPVSHRRSGKTKDARCAEPRKKAPHLCAVASA